MPASTKTLRTWSRGTSWRPQQVLRPTSQEAVVAAIQAARARGCSLRVLGGGHSFSALAATDGITLSLDGLEGLLSADPETGLVTLRGGTRLWAIAELLAPYGLALSVMGDIDRQSIAGAIQTGTHGTGAAFTGFAGMVRGLRLVLADGSVVDTSPSHDPDLFEAARLGLGSIAVVLEVTVQCVPAYRLELVERTEALEPTAASFLADSSRADHHEFFWFPRADRATVRTMRRLPPHAPRHRPARAVEVLQQDVLGNGAWELLCRGAALVPPLSRPLAEIASHLFAGPRVIDDSAAVFVAPRRVRFHESEWALPADRFEEAFAALRARLEAEDVRVTFPLEILRAAADGVWLSTAHDRDTVYIAAHRHHAEEAGPYLLLVQRTLAAFGARPHWGKLHWLGARELTELYPRFEDFRAVRAAADPDGLLMSSYLRHLLG